jgi:glycogen(starch) synthase
MEAWRRCLVGVVPSLWHEPCPTVVIEGMAVGAPIIGSRAGGIPDLLDDGSAGTLIPPGDITALVRALSDLIADPARRTRLSEAARTRSAQFRISTVLPTIEAIYAGVANVRAA